MGISHAFVVCLAFVLLVSYIADVKGQAVTTTSNFDTKLDRAWTKKVRVFNRLPRSYNSIKVGETKTYTSLVGADVNFMLPAPMGHTWSVKPSLSGSEVGGLQIGDLKKIGSLLIGKAEMYRFGHERIENVFFLNVIPTMKATEKISLILKEHKKSTTIGEAKITISASLSPNQKLKTDDKRRYLDRLRRNSFYFGDAVEFTANDLVVGQEFVFLWDGKESYANGTATGFRWKLLKDFLLTDVLVSEVEEFWTTTEFLSNVYLIRVVPIKPGTQTLKVEYKKEDKSTATKAITLNVGQGSIFVFNKSYRTETITVLMNKSFTIYIECSPSTTTSSTTSSDEDDPSYPDEWEIDQYRSSTVITAMPAERTTDFVNVTDKPYDKFDITVLRSNLVVVLKHIRISDRYVLGTRTINIIVENKKILYANSA